MTVHPDGPELRALVATSCRILAAKGLVEGILGHVSARVSATELVVRCRRSDEPGLALSRPEDVWRADLDGRPVDLPADAAVPSELPIHTELLRARPDVGAVIHAHPPAALMCGLAQLTPAPVFGAYNIPAMRLAEAGVPVYPRPVLITRRELAGEMVDAMGARPVCLLYGHGITVAAATVEQATVLAVNLNALLEVTVAVARLGARPPAVGDDDAAELPDLGTAFTDGLTWSALTAELTAGTLRPTPWPTVS